MGEISAVAGHLPGAQSGSPPTIQYHEWNGFMSSHSGLSKNILVVFVVYFRNIWFNNVITCVFSWQRYSQPSLWLLKFFATAIIASRKVGLCWNTFLVHSCNIGITIKKCTFSSPVDILKIIFNCSFCSLRREWKVLLSFTYFLDTKAWRRLKPPWGHKAQWKLWRACCWDCWRWCSCLVYRTDWPEKVGQQAYITTAIRTRTEHKHRMLPEPSQIVNRKMEIVILKYKSFSK